MLFEIKKNQGIRPLAEVFIFQTTFWHQNVVWNSKFLYFKQHFDTKEVIIQEIRKQKYYFDSAIGKYQVDFRRSVTYFSCVYVRDKIPTCLHTILMIIFCDQIQSLVFYPVK